jgi:Flp pilus assembly protein TadG
MGRRLHNGIKGRLGAEAGQTLIITVLALFVMFAMAAFVIDLGGWLRQHHQAQVGADAAALAAANCLGNPQAGSPTCASNADTGNATSAATAIATDNGVSSAAGDVSIDTTQQTVTVVSHTTGAKFFGNQTPAISARAVASYLGRDCSSPGVNCAFIFGMDSTCPDNGVQLQVSGTKVNVNGAIHSNSGYVQTAGGSGGAGSHPTFGTTTYGNGTTPSPCTTNGGSKGANYPAGSPSSEAPIPTWPIDYTKEYPACVAGSTVTSPLWGAVTCKPDGLPSYCTNDAASFTLTGGSFTATTGNIYCAYGTVTGTNLNDPAKWNGSISISGSGITSTNTFIASTINFNSTGSTNLLPCNNGGGLTGCPTPINNLTNQLVFYATATGAGAFTYTDNGNAAVTGDMFVPNGTANVSTGGGASFKTFIEGYDIVGQINGNITGDGPPADNNGGAGNDFLTN